MTEQIVAFGTIIFLLFFWKGLSFVGDKGDRKFFSVLFTLAIIGVFLGGVLDLW